MFMHRSPPTPHARGLASQRGSALIIALVFLLVMTLIGVTAMQGTSQQESMAGNMRDRNLAFQAAEAALRAGETWLNTPGQVGVTRRNDAEGHTALAAPADWDGAAPQPAAQPNILPGTTLLAAAPTVHLDPPIFRRYGIQLPAECYRVYPVTAHGTGGTNTAIVVLRTAFDPPRGGLVACPDT
jgi:type IV pilus assembly protein PilX